jgi:branched-chain amino acid transport system permease protein
MHFDQLPNAVVSAIILSGLYSIVALGFVLLFRAAGVFNFATGQMIMLGTYLYYQLATPYHMPFLVALLGALVTMGALGAVMHIVLLQRLAGLEHWSYAVLTLGVSIVMARVVAIFWGTEERTVNLPLPVYAVHTSNQIAITTGGILTLVAALVLLVGTLWLIRYSKWGIQMRAAAENPVLASQSGIDIDRVFIIGWAATGIILTAAGIVYAYSTVLSQSVGDIGIRGLAPAFVGGMDSAAGVFPGAIVVALIENLAVVYFGESVRDAAVMMVILVMLVIRPTGLFGTPRVRRV